MEFGTYHLSLFFPIKQVKIVLHRDELVPAMLVGNVLEGLKLPCSH